ncbi:MAG TPA: HEAT repeat domain-containing protein [Pirellulales bacterium]|nr:HEAT repeat domain-containing protein [Pirellulales bacterium]
MNEQLAGRLLRCRRCGAAIQAPAADPAYTLAPLTYQAEPIYSQQSGYPASLDLGGGYLAPARPAALPRNRRRRKQSSGVLLWVATAGGMLVGLAIIIAMIVASGSGPEGWVTLLTAPARERNKIRPISPPYKGPSPEPVFQQELGACNKINSVLAGIYDEASACQHRDELVAALREYGELEVRRRDAEFPGLPAEKLERLNAIYIPQFKAAAKQAGQETARILQLPAARQVLAKSLQQFNGVDPERNLRLLLVQQFCGMSMPSANSDFFARYAERHVVEVVVQGLPVEAADPVLQRLREISNCQVSSGNVNDESARFTIAPIRDIRALAAKIDFGTVTVLHVSQSLIVVVADASKIAGLPPPAPPPPPPAPRLQAPDPRDPAFYRRNLEDLSNSNPGYRHAAALRLQSAEPKELRAEIAQAFIKMLGDSDKSLRHLAVQALPVWATADEAVPLLIELLSDSDDGLVDRAIKALAEFKDIRAAGPLCEQANRFGFQVHDALRKLGTFAEPEVIKHLHHPDEAVRKTAIKALGDIGTSRCVPLLQELAKCGDFFIEVEAKSALEQVHRRRY